jgi:hypothetical protein
MNRSHTFFVTFLISHTVNPLFFSLFSGFSAFQLLALGAEAGALPRLFYRRGGPRGPTLLVLQLIQLRSRLVFVSVTSLLLISSLVSLMSMSLEGVRILALS